MSLRTLLPRPIKRMLRPAAQRVIRTCAAIMRSLGTSPEFATGSPFFYYHARFDAEAIMRSYAISAPQPVPGYLVNFLGVVIAPKFLPGILDGRAGQVEGIPIPANWHADIAEWGAVLRSIDLAKDSFTIVELGCGWGCWINNGGVAAKRRGLRVHAIGVEGDEGHIAFAKEACALNNISDVSLYHGIAAANDGVALFPRQAQSGVNWGLEPVLEATEQQRKRALSEGTHDELRMFSLATLSGGRRIDLLHVDIQGGEADLIAGSLPFLCERVAYMVIGTHSRQIEGRLMDLLLDRGWRLEIERAAILNIHGERPFPTVDGVQGWRNLALLPE